MMRSFYGFLLRIAPLIIGMGGGLVWKLQQFISAGLLAPNFGVIHQAYKFHFNLLPIGCMIGALLCIFWALCFRFVRRLLLEWGCMLCVMAGALFALRYYITYVEPEKLVHRFVRLESPKIESPIRILHISDIQAGQIEAYQHRIFKEIAALNVDLILNTGDLLQVLPGRDFEAEWTQLHQLITAVNPRYGTYAVYGDTERELYHYSAQKLAPLKFLSSRTELIETSAGRISLHGLSLAESRSQKWSQRSIQNWLQAAEPAPSFRILMGHSPNYALGVGAQSIDLCLAGHTHGGQFVVPFYGALVTDSLVPRAWAAGFRKIGIPFLNVSAGAGSNRHQGLPPMRLNCPTEMTIIDLVPLGYALPKGEE